MRNQFRILVPALFVLCTAPLFAQSGFNLDWFNNDWFNLKLCEHPWYFGLYAGYSHNHLYMGGAENVRLYKKYHNGNGWTIGLLGRYQLFNWLGFQAEAQYITRAYSWNRTGAMSNYPDCNTITNSFVDFPLLVNLSWLIPHTGRVQKEGLRVFVNGGGWVGVWVLSREKGKETNESLYPSNIGSPAGVFNHIPSTSFNHKKKFDSKTDQRFDGGLIIGTGLQYDLKDISFFAEWRYNYSLTDMAKHYEAHNHIPYMNNNWVISAGILINSSLFGRGR
jgi:hypothetical protein